MAHIQYRHSYHLLIIRIRMNRGIRHLEDAIGPCFSFLSLKYGRFIEETPHGLLLASSVIITAAVSFQAACGSFSSLSVRMRAATPSLPSSSRSSTDEARSVEEIALKKETLCPGLSFADGDNIKNKRRFGWNSRRAALVAIRQR